MGNHCHQWERTVSLPIFFLSFPSPPPHLPLLSHFTLLIFYYPDRRRSRIDQPGNSNWNWLDLEIKTHLKQPKFSCDLIKLDWTQVQKKVWPNFQLGYGRFLADFNHSQTNPNRLHQFSSDKKAVSYDFKLCPTDPRLLKKKEEEGNVPVWSTQ